MAALAIHSLSAFGRGVCEDSAVHTFLAVECHPATDDETGGPFVAIWALAFENSPDPSMRPFKEPITNEKREELIVRAIAGAKQLYDLFQNDYDAAAETFSPARAKVGRNDPCPCGSGKKYKRCCGHVTMH